MRVPRKLFVLSLQIFCKSKTNPKFKKLLIKKDFVGSFCQSILALPPFYFLEHGCVGCHLGTGRQASPLTLDGGAMSWTELGP